MLRVLVLALSLLLLAPGPALANWHEASTPRVRVLARGADQANRIAAKLERMDTLLRLVRGKEAQDHGPAGRLTVYVVDSAGRIGRMAGAASIAGFYSARASGSVAFVPSRNATGTNLMADAILLHEYAHHFMYRNFPGVYPAWFSEGFAEFYSTARISPEGDVTVGYAADHRAYGILMGQQLTMEQLMEPEGRKMTGATLDNLYGRGWLLTHYLTFNADRKGQLSRYLAAIASGRGSLEAARTAFGDLKALGREINRYTRQRLSGWKIPADKLPIPPIAVRRLSAAEAAMIDVHIESASGVTRAEALRLVPRARRAAAPYANDAFAQGVLAEAEYDAGHYAAARDAALRAVAADPKSRQGNVYHGMALAALAEEAEDTSPATYRAVIAPWIRANRLDPDDPLPMVLIYARSSEFNQRNDSIVRGIQYAQRLAPEDRGVRAMAAHEYLQQDNLKAARSLIASLAFDPHAGNRQKMADVLAKIDAGDGKGAVAELHRTNETEKNAPVDSKKDGAP